MIRRPVHLSLLFAAGALIISEFSVGAPCMNDRLILCCLSVHLLSILLLQSLQKQSIFATLTLISSVYYYMCTVNYNYAYLPAIIAITMVLLESCGQWDLESESARNSLNVLTGWLLLVMYLIPTLALSSKFYTPIVTGTSPMFLIMDFVYIAALVIAMIFPFFRRSVVPWLVRQRQRKRHIKERADTDIGISFNENFDAQIYSEADALLPKPLAVKQHGIDGQHIIARTDSLSSFAISCKLATGKTASVILNTIIIAMWSFLLPFLHLVLFIPHSIGKLAFFTVYAPSFFLGKDQGFDMVVGFILVTVSHVFIYFIATIVSGLADWMRIKLQSRPDAPIESDDIEEESAVNRPLWISQPLTTRIY